MAHVLREQTFNTSIGGHQVARYSQRAAMRPVHMFSCKPARHREKTAKSGKGGFVGCHFAVQPNYRQPTDSCFALQLCSQKVSLWVVDRRLWLSIGKKMLILFPFMLLVHLWLASVFYNIQQSVQTLETIRVELMESQKGLKVKRDALLSPERVLMVAAEKYALHVPVKEQINLFQ
jgi:hypothetical protein